MSLKNESEIRKHMSIFLDGEPETEILRYVSSLENEEDFDEFISNLVDNQNPKHKLALNGLKQALFPSTSKKLNKQDNTKNALNKHVQSKPISKSNNSPKETKQSNEKQKGKKKFQDIKTFKEKKKVKDGRQSCFCQGQIHEYMNNCLNCGRIHCEEEGPGPCLFCGVYLDETGRNDVHIENFTPKANTIFDDDKDFFKTGVESTTKSKKNLVIALDFATRKVIETSEEDEKIRKKLLEDCMDHLGRVEKLYKNLQKSAEELKPITSIYDEMVDLLIRMRHVKPTGVEDLGTEDETMPVLKTKQIVLSEDVDMGLCLSMHQPYASLLVAGVKMHEGRIWPTNHRGTLWIAATAKKPDPDEIDELESFYKSYYDDPEIKFPSSYPTSCLLGCVEVKDCLPQNEYVKQYPNGESASPYVFICTNPIILPIFYPIIGKPKIYQLDKDLHKCAKTCLRFVKLME